MSGSVRVARLADADAIQRIYAPSVENAATSFEDRPPSVREMEERIRRTLKTHPWLVWTKDDVIGGYAYGAPHRLRSAYRWSAEVSVYVAKNAQRQGVAKTLYAKLFQLLRRQHVQRLFAGVTLPNPASVRLHESFGFASVGVYPRVGFKLGRWHDVGWWSFDLGAAETPEEFVPFAELACP
ncbi:MAG: arsinothricin resistance N-acetyltransferase ArsN1 family B [Myxococcota bacterium]